MLSDTIICLPTGDGCFYIGMGGKNAKPTIPSYEPYQCCPANVNRGTKVAKVSRVSQSAKTQIGNKLSSSHSSTSTPTTAPTIAEPQLKPINKLTAKESKKNAKIGTDKDKSSSQSNKVTKPKRGFFGSGKYFNSDQQNKNKIHQSKNI